MLGFVRMEKAGGGKLKKRPKNGRCVMMRRVSASAPAEKRQTQKKRAPPETHFMRFSATSVKIHCVNLRGIFAAIACIYLG